MNPFSLTYLSIDLLLQLYWKELRDTTVNVCEWNVDIQSFKNRDLVLWGETVEEEGLSFESLSSFEGWN